MMISKKEAPEREAVIDIGKFEYKRLLAMFDHDNCIGEIYGSKVEYIDAMQPAIQGNLTRMATIDIQHAHYVKKAYVLNNEMHIVYNNDAVLHFAPRFLGKRETKEGVIIAVDAYPEPVK